MYRFLADLILIIHILFVAFVLITQILIINGAVRKWRWIFIPWLRWFHLMMILIVTSESWLGITCPLTSWEDQLRKLAGQSGYKQGFIADYVSRILFYDAPQWLFTLIYSLFFSLVLFCFIYLPPNKHWKNNTKHS